MPERFPYPPLRDVLRARGALPLHGADRRYETTLRRAQRVGTVSWPVADRLAVELAGVHPASVWPDWAS